MFIVLEGIDGSGTTTQAANLAQELARRGLDVLQTAEPSTGSIGKEARERLSANRAQSFLAAETLALLFAADRLAHIGEVIQPALQAGKIVICDRYLLSSWAYQSLHCDLDWVKTLNAHAPWPDLTFFLDLDPEVAAQRVALRCGAREIFDALPLQMQLAASYRSYLTDNSKSQIHRIDASLPISEVLAAMMRVVEQGVPTSHERAGK